MAPARLFDTELAARLLNYPRVALGTMLEELLDVRLLKEHSAADWSTRPLPDEWLTYAALDVELLIELRDVLAEQLVAAGKDEWAAEEFAALAAGAGTLDEPRADPWRRTSGIHRVRTRRGLAYVAELWQIRDEIARDSDRAPSKILPDVAIAELAAVERPDRSTDLPDRRVPATPGASLPAGVDGRAAAGEHPRGGRAAAHAHPEPRSAAAPAVGHQGPGRRQAADPGARGAHEPRRRARGCRPRTCSPRTTCAGWPGRRPIRSARSPWTPPWPSWVPGRGSGASRWAASARPWSTDPGLLTEVVAAAGGGGGACAR